MNDQRRRAADKEAAARRALDPQVMADAERENMVRFLLGSARIASCLAMVSDHGPLAIRKTPFRGFDGKARKHWSGDGRVLPYNNHLISV